MSPALDAGERPVGGLDGLARSSRPYTPRPFSDQQGSAAVFQQPAYDDAVEALRPAIAGVLNLLSFDIGRECDGQVNLRLARAMLDMQVAPLLQGLATLHPQATFLAVCTTAQAHLETLGTQQLRALGRGIERGLQDGAMAAHGDIVPVVKMLVEARLSVDGLPAR